MVYRAHTVRAELFGWLRIDPVAAQLIGPLIAQHWLRESS